MLRGVDTMFGVTDLKGADLRVAVRGTDVVPMINENTNVVIAWTNTLRCEVRASEPRLPPPMMLRDGSTIASIQVFFRRGRAVEVRATWTQGFNWAELVTTTVPPRWADDGGLLPEDDARTHMAYVMRRRPDGGLDLHRSWNFAEHAKAAFKPWRDLEELATAESLPESLQAAAKLVLERLAKADESPAAYALPEYGGTWRDKLVRRVKVRLAELRKTVGMDGESAPEDETGAKVTEAAAAWMAETFKIEGDVQAAELRSRARPDSWSPWRPEDEDEDEDFAFILRVLVLLVWRNEVEAEAERDRTAPSVIEAASTSIGGYSGIPRIAAPMCWAFGGPSISAATVNGDAYALEPEAAASALVPRSFVLTGNIKQPERFNLPLELDPPIPLAIKVTDATGYALTPHAGKLALIIMAHDRGMGGRVYRWTLDALVKSLNPGGRRIESSHYKPVAEGLEQLSKLHAFLPTGQKYRVFYATGLLTDPTTAHARKDAEVVLGIDPVFSAFTQEWGGARGYFLINLDGAMRLDNREPVALRTYVRVAALWNTVFKPGGEPDPGRMKPTHIDKIGLMANNYRHGTVELLQAQGDKKQAKRARIALSEDREKTRETLKKLAACGLLTLKEPEGKEGKHELVILPPAEYLEAWRRHRHPKG